MLRLGAQALVSAQGATPAARTAKCHNLDMRPWNGMGPGRLCWYRKGACPTARGEHPKLSMMLHAAPRLSSTAWVYAVLRAPARTKKRAS